MKDENQIYPSSIATDKQQPKRQPKHAAMGLFRLF